MCRLQRKRKHKNKPIRSEEQIPNPDRLKRSLAHKKVFTKRRPAKNAKRRKPRSRQLNVSVKKRKMNYSDAKTKS